jgi:hypothetical protein
MPNLFGEGRKKINEGGPAVISNLIFALLCSEYKNSLLYS